MNHKEMRILFMGTPKIAAHILNGLIEDGYNIIGLIAQKDKPVGRKGIIEPVPTKKVALEHNIPVYQVEKIRLEYEFVKEIKPDLIVTCAYGQIVPQGLLDIPLYGSINIHGSLLPELRGASPIQSAIIEGKTVSGVTIMEMIDKMDAGAMYLKEEVIVEKEDNYTSLYDKIAEAGLKALRKFLPQYDFGKPNGEEQDERLVTFCSKITKEQEHLNLELSTQQFVNWVRGLSETPGGYLLLDDRIFKIYKADIIADSVNHDIGEIIRADKIGLYLQLSNGVVSLLEVQLQGKSKMSYRDFVNGNKNLVGKILK